MNEVAELSFPDINVNRHGIVPTFPMQTQEELKNQLATSASEKEAQKSSDTEIWSNADLFSEAKRTDWNVDKKLSNKLSEGGKKKRSRPKNEERNKVSQQEQKQ